MQAKTVRAWIDYDFDCSMPAYKELQLYGKHVELHKHPVKFWYPLAKVFRAPYWSRLWVQQEMILATELVFHFRRSEVPAAPLLGFAQAVTGALVDKNSKMVDTAMDLGEYNNQRDIRDSWFFIGQNYQTSEIRRSRTSSSRQLSAQTPFMKGTALALYLDSVNLHVTDPRDRLYGLLALACDVFPGEIQIDYTLRPIAVYAKLFCHFLDTYNSLAFLCCCGSSLMTGFSPSVESLLCSPGENIPTWFPNPFRAKPFRRMTTIAGAAGFISASKATIITSHSDIALQVRGFRVDKILALGKHPDLSAVPTPEWYQDLRALFSRTRSNLSGDDIQFEDSIKELFKDYAETYRDQAMVGSKNTDDGESWPTTLPDIHQRFTEMAHDLGRPHLSTRNAFSDEIFAKQSSEKRLFRQHSTLLLHRRSFILTETGRMGIAADSPPKSGDEVWILFGCPLPVILRQTTQCRYNLISQAWVTGLMNGEACVGVLQSGELEPEYLGPSVVNITLV
jgi:hypothetical protein